MSSPHHHSEIEHKKRIIKCPLCQQKYKANIPINLMDEDDDGIGVILIEPSCKHKFIIFVDKNLKVRGYEKIEYEDVEVERADTQFIKDHIEELEKQHELALRNDYNKAFQLMQEIKKARRKYTKLENGTDGF